MSHEGNDKIIDNKRDNGKVGKANIIGLDHGGLIDLDQKPEPLTLTLEQMLLKRVQKVEEDAARMMKTFADLVPVLDAIIEAQKIVEGQLKPLLKNDGPRKIQ